MRAMVYRAPEQLDLEELGDVDLGPRDLLVRIEACGVCGSDVASYLHGHYAVPGQVLGHELSSVVEAWGDEVHGLERGQRVAIRTSRSCGSCTYCDAGRPYLCGESGRFSVGYGVRGGLADLMVVRDVTPGDDVLPVPDSVATDDLVWAEPLAVAVHAATRAGLGPGAGRTLVVGGGSVGLCVLATARARGVEDVVVVEPRAERRDAAARLGARTLEPAELDTTTERFACVVDTSGSATALAAALALLSPGGRLTMVGLGDAPVPWPPGPVELTTSFAYDEKDFAESVEHIVSGRIRLAEFVSHRFPLAQAGEAIAASAGRPEVTKAVVYPGLEQAQP